MSALDRYLDDLDDNVDGDTLLTRFLEYSRRFGRIHPHPSKMTRHPEYPELTVMGIDKYDAANRRLGPGTETTTSLRSAVL